MIELTWALLTILSAVTFLWLAMYMVQHPHFKEGIKILQNGFRAGLKGSGLTPLKPRYKIERYKWVSMDDDEVCEDCLKRASWPAMDIAEWMKLGLPNTPETDTRCDHCRCELVLENSDITSTKDR